MSNKLWGLFFSAISESASPGRSQHYRSWCRGRLTLSPLHIDYLELKRISLCRLIIYNYLKRHGIYSYHVWSVNLRTPPPWLFRRTSSTDQLKICWYEIFSLFAIQRLKTYPRCSLCIGAGQDRDRFSASGCKSCFHSITASRHLGNDDELKHKVDLK